jgi:hypothetical protein
MKTKKKTGLNIDKDIVLQLILSLRVIPLEWVYKLPEEYDVPSRQIRNIIQQLRQYGFLSIKHSYSKRQMLFLTPKGYNRANTNKIAPYKYRYWEVKRSRMSTIDESHHYFLFRFLLDLLSSGKKLYAFYSQYDLGCKLEWNTLGRSYVIRPDCIVQTLDSPTEMIAFEADTGLEHQPIVYDKILKYLHFAASNFGDFDIEKIKIYFSFGTEIRQSLLFYDGQWKMDDKTKGNIFRYFDTLSTPQTQKGSYYLNIKEILKLLENRRLELYTGTYNQGSEAFLKVPFRERLINSKPLWTQL